MIFRAWDLRRHGSALWPNGRDRRSQPRRELLPPGPPSRLDRTSRRLKIWRGAAGGKLHAPGRRSCARGRPIGPLRPGRTNSHERTIINPRSLHRRGHKGWVRRRPCAARCGINHTRAMEILSALINRELCSCWNATFDVGDDAQITLVRCSTSVRASFLTRPFSLRSACRTHCLATKNCTRRRGLRI